MNRTLILAKTGVSSGPRAPVNYFLRSLAIEQKEKDGPKRTDDLRAAELQEELRSVKKSLQTTIEEIETSNEELRSIVEEYQSANEELQNANEEVNSSKEEMQSLKEELETLNTKLQSKTQELVNANDDMKNPLDSLVIIFIDVHKKKMAEKAPGESEILRRFTENVVYTVRQPLLVMDQDFQIVFAGESFYRTF